MTTTKILLLAFSFGTVAFAQNMAKAEGVPVACSPADSGCLLQLAREAADTLERQLQRDEAHFAITAALAARGNLDEAAAEAALIDNPITQAEAEGEIVRAAARLGAFDIAFDIAIGIGDARNHSAKVLALEALAVEQAAKGDIGAAFETVVAINNPFRRSQAQAAIAVAVAQVGDIPAAVRAAARIGMDYWFTTEEHRYKIASGLVARTGEFDHYWFYEAMAEIAGIQAWNGDIPAGMQTALAIPDQAGRARALAKISAVQVARGEIDAALQTARRIETAYGDQQAMIAIADGLAASNDFDAALEMARAVQDAYGDGAALSALALRQAQAGRFEESLATAADIVVIEDLDRARAAIAREYARAGQTGDALEVVAQIPDRNKRFEAVEEIAVMLATAGQSQRAISLAEEFAGRGDLDELISAITLALARSGNPEAAILTAGRIQDKMFRAITLAGIAANAG